MPKDNKKQQKQKEVTEEVKVDETKVDDSKDGKSDKKQNKRRSKPKRPEVTLETVIPELPKKEDLLEKPSNKEKNTLLDAIDDKFKDLKKQKEQFYDDLSKRNKGENVSLKTEIENCHKERKTIQKQKESIFQQFKVENNKSKSFKKQLDKYENQIAKLSKHFKGGVQNQQKIQREINSLMDSLDNDVLSIAVEANMRKQLIKLQKSVVFCEPLQVAFEKRNEVKKSKGVHGKKSSQFYQQGKDLKAKIDAIFASIDAKKAELKKLEEERQPEIVIQKAKFKEMYKQYKADEDKIYDDFKAKKDAYYDQQKEIKNIEYMKKTQQGLIKDEKDRKYRERMQKEEEKQLDEMRKDFYTFDIQNCEDLIAYCNLLCPQKTVQTEVNTEENTVNQEDVEKQFKNDNVSEIVNKKNLQHDDSWLFGEKKQRKGRRNKKRKRKAFVEQEVNPLFDNTFMHSMEDLQKFKDVKISAPDSKDQVVLVIKQLEEKIQYYKNHAPPSDKVLRDKLNGRDRKRRRRDDDDEDFERKDQQKNKGGKRKNKRNKKAVPNLNNLNSELFPEFD